MGAVDSNLSKLKSHGCKVSKYTVSTVGLKSGSASTSDQWILTLSPGLKYEYLPIKSVFMKFFIDPDYFDQAHGLRSMLSDAGIDAHAQDPYLKSLRSLLYELNFYKGVVRPIIDTNVCTNFVRFIGSGIQCSSDDILSIGIKNNPVDAIENNILFMMCGISGNRCFSDSRPTLSESSDVSLQSKLNHLQLASFNEFKTAIYNFGTDLKFSLLLTENLGVSQSLKNWYYDNLTGRNESRADVINRAFLNVSDPKTAIGTIEEFSDFFKLIFQLLFAVLSLSQSGSNHNDLHIGNIFVEDLGSPTSMIYWIKNVNANTFEKYYMESRYKIRLYDFDRSYSPLIGPNTENSLGSTSVDNYDMVYFLTRFSFRGRNKDFYLGTKNFMYSILTGSSKNKANALNYLSTSDFWLRIHDRPASKQFFEQSFPTSLEAVKYFGSFFSIGETFKIAERQNISIFDASYYDLGTVGSNYLSFNSELAESTNKNIIDEMINTYLTNIAKQINKDYISKEECVKLCEERVRKLSIKYNTNLKLKNDTIAELKRQISDLKRIHRY